MTSKHTMSGVKVKELEWVGPDSDGEHYSKDGLFLYIVRPKYDSKGYWLTNVGKYFPTREAAKAAAQADYEARILAALAPSDDMGWLYDNEDTGREFSDGYEGMEYDDDCEVACQRSNTFIRELARRLAALAPSDAEPSEAAVWGWVIPRGVGKKPVILDAERHDEASAAAEADIHDMGYFPLYTHPDSSGEAVRITDEMVEKAARALSRFGKSFPTIDDEIEWVDTKWPRYKDEARTALIAALNGEVKK